MEQDRQRNLYKSVNTFEQVIFRCTFLTYLIVSALRFNRYEACFCFLVLRNQQIQVVDCQNDFCNPCTTLLFAVVFCSVYGCKGNKNLRYEQIFNEKISFYGNFSFKVKKRTPKVCGFRILVYICRRNAALGNLKASFHCARLQFLCN